MKHLGCEYPDDRWNSYGDDDGGGGGCGGDGDDGGSGGISLRERGCGPPTKETSLDSKQDYLARVRNASTQFSIYQTVHNFWNYRMLKTCRWLSRISQFSRRDKGQQNRVSEIINFGQDERRLRRLHRDGNSDLILEH